MKKSIKEIEAFLIEWIPEYALSIAFVLSVIVCIIQGLNLWTRLTAIGCIFSVIVTLAQWASARRVKRAELVDQLINKLVKIKTNSEEEPMDDTTEEAETRVYKLAFLSYVAYLGETHVLSEAEFNALRLDLVSIMENGRIQELIVQACKNGGEGDFVPYKYLVQYGSKYCKKEIAEEYEKLFKRSDNMNDKVDVLSDLTDEIDDVSSSKTYKTHLDVLNVIFKFGYSAHMRGAARLPDGSMVWFPNYTVGEKREDAGDKTDSWVNVFNEKDNVILEYCPKDYELTDEKYKKRHYGRRFAFGKDLANPQIGYRFLGVYESDGKGTDYVRYKLVKSSLSKKDVQQSLGL